MQSAKKRCACTDKSGMLLDCMMSTSTQDHAPEITQRWNSSQSLGLWTPDLMQTSAGAADATHLAHNVGHTRSHITILVRVGRQQGERQGGRTAVAPRPSQSPVIQNSIHTSSPSSSQASKKVEGVAPAPPHL